MYIFTNILPSRFTEFEQYFYPFRLRLTAASLTVLFGPLFQPDCTASLFWGVGVVFLLSINFFNQFLSVVTDSGLSLKSQGVVLIT
jgi:hypothetical protein